MRQETVDEVDAKSFDFKAPPTNAGLHDKAKQIAESLGKTRIVDLKSGAYYKIAEVAVPISSSIENKTLDRYIGIRNLELHLENPAALPSNSTFLEVMSATSDPKPNYYRVQSLPHPDHVMFSAQPFAFDTLVEFNPQYSVDPDSIVVQTSHTVGIFPTNRPQRRRITPIQARQVDGIMDFFAEAVQAYQNLTPIESATPSTS